MKRFCQVLLTPKEIEDPMINLRRIFRDGKYFFEFLDSKTMYKLNFLANNFKNGKLDVEKNVLIGNDDNSNIKLNVEFKFVENGLKIEIFKNHISESRDSFDLDLNYFNYPIFIVDKNTFNIIDFNVKFVLDLSLKIKEVYNKSFFDFFSIQTEHDASSINRDHIVRLKKNGKYYGVKNNFLQTSEFDFDVYLLDSVDEYLKIYELNEQYKKNREKLRFRNSHVLRSFLANAIGISLIFKDPDLDKDEFVTLNETLLNSLNSLDKELRELIKESNLV